MKFSDFAGLGAGGRKLPIFVPEFKNFIQQLTTQMQQNYCEHDSLFVLVNTPLAFRAIWAVIKVLLTKRQSSKMRILGDTSSAGVVASIREVIQDNVLPTEYGGRLKSAVGAFPAANPADCEAWYKGRHLVKQKFMEEKEQGDLFDNGSSKPAAQEESKMSMTPTKATVHDDAPPSEASTIPTVAEINTEINTALPPSDVVAALASTAEHDPVQDLVRGGSSARMSTSGQSEPQLDDQVVTPAYFLCCKVAKGGFCS